MGIINISSREYTLHIAGLNCTVALKSADGNYSHYDQTGLSLISATFVLGRALGFTESLDDRTNPRWARGNKINFQIANSQGTLELCPVLGTLYILDATYDGTRELTIEAGCIFSLLNFRTPRGDGICFDLGQTRTPTAVASTVLQRVGITNLDLAIPGPAFKVPFNKLSQESYIAFAGTVAWVNGAFLYQDRFGTVRSKVVQFLGARRVEALAVGINDVAYDRLTGAEAPAERLRVTGSVQELKKNGEETTDTTINYAPTESVTGRSGSSGMVISERNVRTETVTFNSPGTRRIKSQKYQPEGLIFPDDPKFKGNTRLRLAEEQVEEFFYEASTKKSGVVAEPSRSADNCNQADERRLLRQRTTIYRPTAVIYREYFSLNPEKKLVFSSDNLAKAEETLTTYEYLDFPIDGEESTIGIATNSPKPPVLTITTERSLSTGEVLPEEEYALFNFLQIFRPVERTISTWQEVRPGEWLKRERFYKSFYLKNPEVIEQQENDGYVLSKEDKLRLIADGERRTQSNSGGAQPPAPDRFPSQHSVTEKAVKEIVRLPPAFGYQYREREREISVPGGFLVAQSQLKGIGEREGQFLWGRYKGQKCAVALSDTLFTATPLDRTDWTDIEGTSHAFLMDGLTIAVAQRRVVVQYDGVWVGIVKSAPVYDGETVITPGVILAPYRRTTTVMVARKRAIATNSTHSQGDHLCDHQGNPILTEIGDFIVIPRALNAYLTDELGNTLTNELGEMLTEPV